MTSQELFEQIKRKKSFLCVGLDTDLKKIPSFLLDNECPVFEFNRRIIDATHEYAVAYKPNLAFYECLGSEGWLALEKTVKYIRKNFPEIFLIADAKRGDIGNTSEMYAQAFFEKLNFDSVTVAPYMGEDSVKPFFKYPNKWVILLALTSNKGAKDFQLIESKEDGSRLFETVLRKSQEWGTTDTLMYVVGATQAKELAEIRKIIPNHFLLVPGVGAQGGSLKEVAQYGMNAQCGLLVNASRSILYADNTSGFAAAAQAEASTMQEEMAELLKAIL